MRLITTLVTLALSVNVAAGLVWWVQKGRLDATQAQVAALQQEVRAQSTELLGYTRYTSYLTVGKDKLSEQMKLLSATVVRDEGTTQIVEKSVLGLPSTGVVAISYTVEYAFGYDLRPESYELKATDTGIEIHIAPPPPGHRTRRHGPAPPHPLGRAFHRRKDCHHPPLARGHPRRARQQGEAMASEPAILALCEKSLTEFLYGFLSKQPGVRQVSPHQRGVPQADINQPALRQLGRWHGRTAPRLPTPITPAGAMAIM